MTALIQGRLDYTNDECMYMFSEGQAARMTNYVNTSLTNLTSNAAKVIDGEPVPQEEDNTNDNSGGDTAGDQPVDDSTGGETSGDETVDSDGDDNSEDESNDDDDFDDEPFNDDDYFDEGTDTITSEVEQIIIAITLDEFGSETAWKLKDEFNQVIAEGGPYEDGQNGVVIEQYATIKEGCYDLTLTDAFGDGICCDYGDGKLEVFDESNNLITSSNGSFGTRERLVFCKEAEGLIGRKGSKDRRAKNLASKK